MSFRMFCFFFVFCFFFCKDFNPAIMQRKCEGYSRYHWAAVADSMRGRGAYVALPSI